MKFYFFKRLSIGLTAMFLLFGFAACNTEGGDVSKTGGKSEGTVDIVLPPAAEREVLTQNGILGTYMGNCTVIMDGRKYGPYGETVKIDESVYHKITFVSEKTVYDVMPVDFSYAFSDIKLTADSDGKAFSFTGTGGELITYTKGNNNGRSLPGKNTAVRGFFYKKGGKLYCSYIVDYNMDDIRAEFPLMPPDHKTLSSITRDAARQ